MVLKELNIADEVFYWGRTGSRPTVIETACQLKETIDAAGLKSALAAALTVHTNFSVRPVICRGRLKASLDRIGEVPLFSGTKYPNQLGTDETNGYMFYCSYTKERFMLHVFHGVADLRGILNFMNTVLMFYFAADGQEIRRDDFPYPTDTAQVYEKVMEKKGAYTPEGRYTPGKNGIFHFPEPRFSAHDPAQRLFEIDIPAEPLLRFAKSCESSVFPLLQTITGHAIRKMYDVGDADIAGYGAVDVSPIYNVKSGGNSAASFTVPYTSGHDVLAPGECAKRLRKEMRTQLSPENLFVGIAANVEPIQKMSAIPYVILHASGLSVAIARRRDTKNNTYGLSYAGHVSFGEQIDRHIAAVSARAGAYSYPLWMVACEFGGMLRIMITQDFETDTAVRGIFREIKEFFPDAVLTDCGMNSFCKCHVKNFERIRCRKDGIVSEQK